MNPNALSLTSAQAEPRSRHVLVVDDDFDFADGLAAVLELNGFSVGTAHDIASAEASAKERRPDMAVLDICIGLENGIDLLNRFLADYPGLPCVMATAHAELDTAIRAVKSGAYDYLRKPLHAEELLAVLARCDETLRLREETALAQNSARRERGMLFDAIESIADGFALYDFDDRLVLHNNRLTDMLEGLSDVMVPGASFEEVVRHSIVNGGVRAAEGRVEEYVQDRLERHRNPKGPFEIETRNGRLLRIEERTTADGGRVCLYSDVTARRHVEEALVESESRFKDMVANVPGVVFQMEKPADDPAIFHFVSSSAIGLLGLDPDMVMADPSLWFDLVHPDDRPGFDASLLRSARDMKPWAWEGRMSLDSGSAWWCQGAARPKRLPNGGTLWNGIILDVTERKELEEQLLQSQRMKVVGQLSGGIAHDFNNLMLAAMLNIETARDIDSQPDDTVRHLNHALDSLASAKELTQRLLAFSRQQPLDPRPTDINGLVSEITNLVKRTSGGEIAIEERLEESLGHAMVDPRQLESALINLALNARDAMPGGGRLTIATQDVELNASFTDTLEEVDPGDYVMISLTDTGGGMVREVAERAFEPFFTTKEVGEGSGLGLSMVYGFLKQSRGHVSLDSHHGKGTTITLYLPRTAPSCKATAPSAPSSGNKMPRGHETILVVEDEPSVRAVVVQLLKNLGYTVIEAEDGVDALARLDETGEIDMLFTDIVLPGGMTGKDVAVEVLKRQPAVRLLYTSGYAAGVMDEGGRVAEGGEFLSKPYPMKALASRIREILDETVG
ncbi:MAG: response regulator [Proteobacteria bacterium]|nr:response regulator [Pseudomonadota bacterium]